MHRAKGKRPKIYDKPTRCNDCEHINISKLERPKNGEFESTNVRTHCYKCRKSTNQEKLDISILNAIKMITKERYAHEGNRKV